MTGLVDVFSLHRFQPTRSVDGTLKHGWCGCGGAWETKPIADWEAHLADVVLAWVGEVLASNEVRGEVFDALPYSTIPELEHAADVLAVIKNALGINEGNAA